MSGNSGPRTYKAPPTFVTPGNPSFALYNANEDWDASAWFHALSTVGGPPGAKTTYDEPRPRGFHEDTDPNDFTSFIYGQAEVTEHHWPDVMYLLRPPPEREAYLTKAAPGQLHDSRGLPMVEKWPIQGRQARPLKELAGLPDNISSNETWDRIEFWRRMNPRILMEDILMRMHPDQLPRTTVGDTRLRNSLNMRASRRAYPEYYMISWFGKGLDGGRLKHTARDETLQLLTPQQIAANTTRGSTPGLVNPTVGERPGNRIELPAVNNACLTRRCGGRQAISRSAAAPRNPVVRRKKAAIKRKRSPDDSEEDEEDEEEEEDDEKVTKVSRKRARKGGERNSPERVDIVDDMREKIGAFKNLLGINGHPRGQKRGQRHASMPAGTFVGPPNALESQRTQERSLSLPADEESMAPEPPVDPALLERADDGPQSPGISHEDSLEFLAQFEANLPQSLRGWLGAREPGVPYLPSNQDPTLAPSPLPAPPGTVDPRLITSSPNEAGSPWMVGSLPEDDNALVLGSSPEQHNALIEAQNFIQQTDYDDINNFPELGDLYDSNDFSQFPF